MVFCVSKHNCGGFVCCAIDREVGGVSQHPAAVVAGFIQPCHIPFIIHADHEQASLGFCRRQGTGQSDGGRSCRESHIYRDSVPLAVLIGNSKIIDRMGADLCRRVQERAQIGGGGCKGDRASGGRHCR